MNDRFKFRAWDKSFRRMIYNIFFFWKENTITVYELHKDASKSYLPNSHIVLEQCTGLKDKNGRLIYEGDIVKRIDKYDSESSAVLLQVEWNNKGGRYITTDKTHDTWTFSYSDYEYEVIGNIHENPELLEAQNDKENN